LESLLIENNESFQKGRVGARKKTIFQEKRKTNNSSEGVTAVTIQNTGDSFH
jgi:hypothetical protein